MLQKTTIAMLLMVFLAATASAQSREYHLDMLEIAHPWARATVGTTGGAFLEVNNRGTAPDQLVGASSPVAAKVELHETKTQDGVMRMQPVASIEIPPGGSAKLAPGSIHLMLIGLRQSLKEGVHFPMTLIFTKAGKIEVEVSVEKAGAMNSGDPMQGHQMHH
jgi:hypothetical protein